MVEVYCEAGEIVTGGGWRPVTGDSSLIVASYPTTSVGGLHGWIVTLDFVQGQVSPEAGEVYAICVSYPEAGT